MEEVQALTPTGTQHLIDTIKEEKESTFRFTTMPTASAENVGRIVQFVGTTSGGYTHGYFYECKENSGSYSWQQTDIQPDVDISGKEDKFRYTTMPTASADWLGKTVEYTGATTQTYTHSKRYECQLVSGNYQWVQESSGTQDDRIKNEILEVGVRSDVGEIFPYIKYAITDINQLSYAEIVQIATDYYNGDRTLASIQESIKLGQTFSIDLPAIAAGTAEAHAAQTVEMMLVAYNTKLLKTAINGKTKALFTFHMKDCLLEGITASTDTYGILPFGADGTRQTWCDETFFGALPSELQSGIKTVQNVSYRYFATSTDTYNSDNKVWIMSNYEIVGGGSTKDAQCSYYTTVANRKKKQNGSYVSYRTSNAHYGPSSSFVSYFYLINASGQQVNGATGNSALPVSLAFCI